MEHLEQVIVSIYNQCYCSSSYHDYFSLLPSRIDREYKMHFYQL